MAKGRPPRGRPFFLYKGDFRAFLSRVAATLLASHFPLGSAASPLGLRSRDSGARFGLTRASDYPPRRVISW